MIKGSEMRTTPKHILILRKEGCEFFKLQQIKTQWNTPVIVRIDIHKNEMKLLLSLKCDLGKKTKLKAFRMSFFGVWRSPQEDLIHPDDPRLIFYLARHVQGLADDMKSVRLRMNGCSVWSFPGVALNPWNKNR
jgi:hypothetical protein